MEIHLVRTSVGLQAYSDEDYELLKKVKVGTIVKAKIVQPRNVKFHRKFFALINAAWDCLTEQQRTNLRSKDTFREQLLITSGFSEPLFDINGQQFLERAKSISFAKMDEPFFNEVYNRVLDTILTLLIANGVSEAEFNNILSNYS
jgi:hypothetical protein